MRPGKTILLLISLLFFSLLQGCSSGNTDAGDTPSGSADQPVQNVTRWGGPARQPDLWGQVKTIRGNKLTVYKVENNAQNLSEEERKAQRGQMQSLSPEERAKARAERIKVSNETVDVIIPVGVPVIATGNFGAEATEVDISQIKQGDIIKLWLESKPSGDEEAMAEFVQIIQGGYGQ
ncbi:hypothetical protein [Desulfofundulus salinus]|uniref:DUF3221 domain-containing protein n=1 Tax=Desulfofundulus salinus TaxID=2419843 RepID=A0A494WXI7_9FIRM|nr:hypothetical protein [Desulfofundulus salinum]RKO65577.1 hypothetical protein D7024_00405 [Desulfofundulus salinum]